jgi:hypothetical protein
MTVIMVLSFYLSHQWNKEIIGWFVGTHRIFSKASHRVLESLNANIDILSETKNHRQVLHPFYLQI